MRTFAIVFLLTLLVCGACLVGPGCSLFPPDDCASHLRCSAVDQDAPTDGDDVDAMPLAESAVADVDGSDVATSEGGDGTLDGTNLPDRACDPTKSPHDAPCVVEVGGAVFVAPLASGGSDATGNGTRSAPYATIGHALANLAGRGRVYICDGTYAESVSLAVPASLFGGLSCPDGDGGWNYIGGTADIHGEQNRIPLEIDRVPGAIAIEDLAIAAANASGQDDAGNGRSSIGALVNASTVVFRRCSFTAASGDNGVHGGTSSNYSNATAPNGSANDGGIGGAGATIVCGDGTNSRGGNGGNGAPLMGAAGKDGSASPMPPITMPGFDGLGGSGGLTNCSGGNPGANGLAGDDGGAATSGNYGTLSATGWSASAGGSGRNGNPGQGGGGGSGKSAPTLGGAGGGAGGCGGAGGIGGGGGGASIALACIESVVTLERCTLAASAAGNGGNGSVGQPGQGGGSSASAACSGGYGGNGAGGGGGTGGAGGVSVCVLYKGNGPTGTRSCAAGPAGMPGGRGQGGAGGTNALNNAAPDGGPGADGLSGVSDAALQVP
ncbi:MAG: hypothetical protein M3O46_11120 [Myxococcota bacterium]|nr:hypothetical protein [Myxococcota bacterium]